MKQLITILLFSCCTSILSQNVEFIAGVNHNSFFDTGSRGASFSSDYTPATNPFIRVTFEGKKPSIFRWRVAVGYDRYSGDVTATYGVFGDGVTTEAHIVKSVFTLSYYAINFNIWNKLDVNFGLELSNSFSNSYRGTWTSISTFGIPVITVQDLRKRYSSFNSKLMLGLVGRLAYDFKISEKMNLSPQFSYYYGLTSEFVTFPESTKSMRFYFGTGIEWKLQDRKT